MIIGTFDTAQQPLLIAEIGNNHEGERALAYELAHAALDAGAHVVKFQIVDPTRLVNRHETQRIAQLSRYRLPLETMVDIAEKVKGRGGLFMASAFDTESLTAIAPYLDIVKIASGDLNFTPLLACASSTGKPLVLSTGMSTLEEIKHAVATVAASRAPGSDVNNGLAILHCVSLYPTPQENANLAAIQTLRETFAQLTVGYSDHTLGIEAALVAAALGARVIEKHFTLNKAHSTFRDHALSADPGELARLAQVLRVSDRMLGTGDRAIEMADAETRKAARRSIVAARDLPAGTTLALSDLDFVRPANGLPPTALDKVVGRRLAVARPTHESIQESDLA